MKRGDIYFADLSPVKGSEQGGVRPVVIIQNDIGNRYSPTVIVAAITSQIHKGKLPTHINVSKKIGLEKDSVILCEQVRTLDKTRLTTKVATLDENMMDRIDRALMISIGLVKLGSEKAS